MIHSIQLMKYTSPHNTTLLEALGHLSPNSSKTTLRSWLKEGRVAINGKPQKVGSTPVTTGQTVTVSAKTRVLDDGLRIIYEDDHIVAIDKPEGMLSVSTDFEKGHTAHALLKKKFRPRRVYVVHRLDQDTSGVMIFALNEKTKDLLKKTFEKHDIERSYTAIIEGHLDDDKGTWECLLAEDANYFVHKTNNPEKGKLAITHYEVEAKNEKFSRLKLTLETGRKNQIRVHCQLAGHPIVGDNKYDAVENPIRRLCLHAHLLAFTHPITKKQLRFESPVPEKFKRVIKG